jgi:hypothetical protein
VKRSLFSISIIGALLAVVVAIAPITAAFAQQQTPTPIPGIQPTNAPGAQPTVATTGTPVALASPGSKVMEAYYKAKEALGKKLKRNLVGRPVKSFTYEIVAFNDSELGCAAAGVTARPGFVGGYTFTITLFDNTVHEVRTNVDASKIVFCASSTAPGAGTGPSPIGGKITGGFEYGGQVQEFSLGTVAKMNSAKMKWVKFQAKVGDGGAIGLINAAKAQGYKALLSVVGDIPSVVNESYWNTYASYVGQLAAAGAGAIEVWNEQNIEREWPRGQIDPVKYTGLLAKAATAIKAANPSTIVISGAPAPTGFFGAGGKGEGGWNDDVYLAGMAAAGAANYFDCVGVHYNEGVVSPTQSSGDPRDSYPTRYFATMLARATGPFPGKPACFTELGFLTPEGYGPLSPGFAWAAKTTVAQQAQWLKEAMLLSSAGGKVRLVIVFNVDFSFYGTDPMAGFAMIRPGGSCPACEALASVQ